MLEQHVDRASVYRIWNLLLFSMLALSLSFFLYSLFSLSHLSLPSHPCFSKFRRSREPTRRSFVTLYGYTPTSTHTHVRTHTISHSHANPVSFCLFRPLVLILRFRSNGRWIDLKTRRQRRRADRTRSCGRLSHRRDFRVSLVT